MENRVATPSILDQDIEAFHFTSNELRMPHMHMHMTFELLYIKSGSTIIKNNAKAVELHGPCVIVHNPYTLHSSHTTSNNLYERYVINFSNKLARKLSPWVPYFNRLESIGFKYIDLDEDSSELMDDYFKMICEQFNQNHTNRCELLLGLLLDTLTQKYFSQEVAPSYSENNYLTKLLQHIGNNFRENIKIDDLADKFFVSRSKLMSDFKSVFGMTIKQYLQLIRINNAKAMLLSGMSITDTANACGFCNDSHFISTFRNITGKTPKIYANTPHQGILS